MLISDLIKRLHEKMKAHGDLQVAICNCEFFNHDPFFDIEVAKKENDCNEPFETSELLNDTFLSIRSCL